MAISTEEALSNIRHAYAAWQTTHMNAFREYYDELEAFQKARREHRSHTDTETFLEQCEAKRDVLHHYGNASVNLNNNLEKSAHPLSLEQLAEAYKNLSEGCRRVSNEYTVSVGILLNEIESHPEYAAAYESADVQRIKENLEQSVQNAKALGQAGIALANALGINPEMGQGRSSGKIPNDR